MPVADETTDGILEGRRVLIEETKRFKSLDDASKLLGLQKLLQLYHAEIDSLAVRCRNSHSVIHKLKESNDRSRADYAALEQQNTAIKHQLAEESRRLAELTDDFHLLSRDQTSVGKDESIAALKKEYKAALERLDHLQNRDNPRPDAAAQQELHTTIHRLQQEIAQQKEKEQRLVQDKLRLEDALAKGRQEHESNMLDAKHPALDQSRQEIASLTHQVQLERKERSRLEADNLILVERLKKTFTKAPPSMRDAEAGTVTGIETGTVRALKTIATGTRLVLWGATSGSAAKRAIILVYLLFVHIAMMLLLIYYIKH